MPASASGQLGVREHADDGASPVTTRVARAIDAHGLEGAHALEMAAHQPVWDVHVEYGRAAPP